MEDKKGKTNKGEAEDLSTSESYHETVVGVFAAHESGSSVSVNSDSHANVTSKN
jgi:hypothetical protein